MSANPECIGLCPILETDLEAIKNSNPITNAMANEDYKRHSEQSKDCSGAEIISRHGETVQRCPLFNIEVSFADRSVV
jgi:hypothetical protein